MSAHQLFSQLNKMEDATESIKRFVQSKPDGV